MQTKIFDILFKKASTGAIQQWEIWSEENEDGTASITTRWGQVEGAVQTTTDIIKTGKNIGKKNETSAAQQAHLEAKARWEKQLKKGYVQNIDAARAGQVDDVIEGGVVPMLAHKYSEQGHKMVYPALAQPKLDGHRCIAILKGGKATLWTRTRKPITGMPHIIAALEILADAVPDVVLDGELYNGKDTFEELSSFIRTPEPKAGHEAVQYHIYDVINDQPQWKRLQHIEDLATHTIWDKATHTVWDKKVLVPVKTIVVVHEDAMREAFSEFLEQGYEGLMVRHETALYENKRSYFLQKVKEFDSAEFKVKRVEEGRGKLAGHAIFVCETEDGVEFNAKMKGDTSKLKEYFDNPELVVGHLLEVKFQGFTNKSRVPRFPIGMRVKDIL